MRIPMPWPCNSQHALRVQVEAAIHDGAGKTKFETQDFRLKPQKTLFGYDATEKVEGWTCRIFEANGRMTAMEHLKVIGQSMLPPTDLWKQEQDGSHCSHQRNTKAKNP